MKKDLSQYYAEVTAKDAKKVLNLYEKFNKLRDLEWVLWAIEHKAVYLSLNYYGFGLCTKYRIIGKKKISLKTFQNYVMINKQIEDSFTEPIELRKLTEENTSLINEVHSLNKEKLFLLNEVQHKETSFNHCNDLLNKQIDKNEKLKRENYSKSVVIGIVSFFLLVALVFITQKL